MNDLQTLVWEKDDKQVPDLLAKRIIWFMGAVQRDILIAMNGASCDVGKSSMQNNLQNELEMQHGVVCDSGMPLDLIGTSMRNIDLSRECYQSPYGVILINHVGGATDRDIQVWRTAIDNRVQSLTEGRFSKIDMIIGLFRPDEPFSSANVMADVLIENRGATIK